VGRIFVHIDGENPHTRIQTALNRLSFQPGEIIDIREVKASERRLQASSLFHVDAARNVYPKITYRIPELENTEFSADGGGESFRGQSPDVVPVPEASTAGDQVYEVRMPVASTPAADEAIDVHLDFTKGTNQIAPSPNPFPADAGGERSQPAVQHVVNQAPKTAEQDAVGWQSAPAPPANKAYGNLSIPTQNPYQPPMAVAPTPYSTPAPANRGMAERMPGFGGQTPRATSPQTAPIPSGTQNAVQPAQYAAPLPGQQPQYIAPGPVIPDPTVTPIPGGSTILPGDPWGPPGQPYADPAVDVLVNLEETQTGRLMVGVGVNSDAGVVGQILLDERNFDWTRLPTSWQDFADGTAFRGAGQRFRIEAAPGTRVQRYLISFTEPYLMDTPISLSLSASYFDRIYRDWDEQRVGGRVGLGYQWTENDLSALVSYRGEDVLISNVSNPGLIDFQEVVGHNALHGFGLTVTNDTRDNPFLATMGHYLQFSVEQVIGSFSYPKAEIDARKYFLVNERPDHSGRHVISVGTRLGFAGDDTPIYDRFFAGGFSTMRGFDFRGASPVVDDVQVGGDFQWLNSVEYLFPITADDMLHGVAFCDFGTTEPNVSINDFRVAPGVGLRITVPAMGPAPIALDFAWPVVRADTDDTQVFSFFIGFMR
jgi:outer membrane protein insertion porin family